MSRAAEPHEGWTLGEALERTANPKLWRAWITAKNAREKGRVSTPSSPSALLGKSPHQIQSPGEAADDAFQKIKNGLWCYLTDERLAATGSRDSDNRAPTPIPSAGWQSLVANDWEKSVVQEGTSGSKVYNVRIFPILLSSDAHARLVDRSLSDVFRKFVIEDPEIAALGKRTIWEDKIYVSVFREGHYPGGFYDFKWPLDLTTKELVSSFAEPFYTSTSPLRRASDVIENVSRAIVSRWQALRGMLIGGRLIARGTFSATGVVGVIDRLQWRRAGLWIDVRNGDLLEDENNKPVLKWSGLALMAPTVFHVKHITSALNTPVTTEHAKRERKPTAVQVSTGQAEKELWPNGLPEGMPVQVRDQRIIEWQKKKGPAVASPKTIQRYFQQRR